VKLIKIHSGQYLEAFFIWLESFSWFQLSRLREADKNTFRPVIKKRQILPNVLPLPGNNPQGFSFAASKIVHV